jgi:hypothetical protein
MPTIKEYINHLQTSYRPNDVVAVHLWQVTDVLGVAEQKSIKCSIARAKRIIEHMHSHCDSELGITWVTIECAFDYVK